MAAFVPTHLVRPASVSVASQNLLNRWEVTGGMRARSIGGVLAATNAGRPGSWPVLAAPMAALLTRRRPVDYCLVAAALCPPQPRQRQSA